MATKKKIEVFSAGCSPCKDTIELVKRIAGSSHEVVVHDMHRAEVASQAQQYGVRSVPAVVIDGKLAGAVRVGGRMSMCYGLLSARSQTTGFSA
jgi:glutaredoxin